MLHVSEGYRLPFRRTLTTKRARMTPRPSMSPLAIVLPHPGLPRRRSSMLSAGSCASPHTPRSCVSPTLLFAANNRKSSDSWGSSIQDIGDDLESEWLPEHLVLLERVRFCKAFCEVCANCTFTYRPSTRYQNIYSLPTSARFLPRISLRKWRVELSKEKEPNGHTRSGRRV